jgi:hypothetical protein
MKSLKFIPTVLACILFCGQLIAQVINVPNKSEKHFSEKYPKAANVNWKNNVTDYSASFDQDNLKHKAHYHMDGVWDYTETFLTEDKFPADVKSALTKSRYSEWKILSADLVENNKGEKMYRYELKKGIEKKYIFFDKDGKEIKSKSTI